ncbi:MAG: hypothetical protein CM15mP120_00400 [Pseudomonadota bacterium]|nr:MAG: hypothetical protein CM15mP120_00400 [Pseudomonadota bacterium]
MVDTNGRGVERLTETGVVANGEHFEVDCLIFATGFEVGTSYTRRSGYDIVGRGGQTLSEHWQEGLRTFQGLTSHGFPNCFFLCFTQTAVTQLPPCTERTGETRCAHFQAARDRKAPYGRANSPGLKKTMFEIAKSANVGARFTRNVHLAITTEGKRGNRSGSFQICTARAQ